MDDDQLTHVNLLKYEPEHEQRVVVEIPIKVIGHELSPGVKKGGLLNIVMPKVQNLKPRPSILDPKSYSRTPHLPRVSFGLDPKRCDPKAPGNETKSLCGFVRQRVVSFLK